MGPRFMLITLPGSCLCRLFFERNFEGNKGRENLFVMDISRIRHVGFQPQSVLAWLVLERYLGCVA